MDTFDKVLIVVLLVLSFGLSIVAIASASEQFDKIKDLEKRVIVLETKVNIYEGAICRG